MSAGSITTAELARTREELLEALLERRSTQHGFTYTREHLAIENTLDRLEAGRPGRPTLTLVEGGR